MTAILDQNLADPAAQTRADRLDAALNELASAAARLTRLRQHWHGEQPAAYLSAESRANLDNRLSRLAVNFPRLAVLALAERVRLSGIVDTRAAAAPLTAPPSTALWDALTDAGIEETAATITTDRLLLGSSYATVWATETARLTVTADSPVTMTHASDPATGETLYAVRAWSAANQAHAVLYEPDAITIWRQAASSEPIPGSGWKRVDTLDNPLAVVPVIPFVRRVSGVDPATGASAAADILDLTDAVAKLLADAMVTSEFYARPRRWATGLEIVEDEDGNPVDPFGSGRFLQSEAPETKFGQLDPARLDGYADMIATLTQQIGALTGLPANYLGLHGDQPASADAVKAAEVQLSMRAYSEQQRMTRPWQDVAWLAAAVTAGTPADPADRRRYSVAWASPEIRTQAQAADAAAKLAGIGVPLPALLADPLGYPPDRIADIADQARQQQIVNAAVTGGIR